MTVNNNKELLIVFEGIDGCGKTTQAKLLNEWLCELGVKTLVTKQPGGTETGEIIRELLLNPSLKKSSYTELFLLMADRAQHIKEVVKPALEEGLTVICDRWSLSTIAYQVYGRGISLELVKELNNRVNDGIVPDLLLMIDVCVEKCLKRKEAYKKDFIEEESIEFYELVRRGYLKSIDVGLKNKIVKDGTKEEVSASIKKAVGLLLNI